MGIPFLTRRRAHPPTAAVVVEPGHRVESGYDAGSCRFRLCCSCGAEFDTRYIDEALEWRQMHEMLAPLADQLSV